MVFFVYMGPEACVVETTTTTLSSTEAVAATSYDTVYTPSGTVTESPTVTVTNTPALAMTTTTEVVEEQACASFSFKLLSFKHLPPLSHNGPDYYTENVIVTTTPLISTVTVSTVSSISLSSPFSPIDAHSVPSSPGCHDDSSDRDTYRDFDSRRLNCYGDLGRDGNSRFGNVDSCRVCHLRYVPALSNPRQSRASLTLPSPAAPRDCPTGIVVRYSQFVSLTLHDFDLLLSPLQTVTTTPPAATVTSTSTPAAATVSSTSVVTSTPPVTTSTAIQSVATGSFLLLILPLLTAADRHHYKQVPPPVLSTASFVSFFLLSLSVSYITDLPSFSLTGLPRIMLPQHLPQAHTSSRSEAASCPQLWKACDHLLDGYRYRTRSDGHLDVGGDADPTGRSRHGHFDRYDSGRGADALHDVRPLSPHPNTPSR